MTASSASIGSLRASPMVRRAVRDGLGAAGLLFAAYLFLVVAPRAGTFGFDAYAYWSLDMADPYTVPAGTFGAFTYTPVIARLFAPFSLLEWPTFLWLWTAVMVATVIWLGWRSALLVLAFPPVALELYHGNVQLLMAAAIALGFRYPVAWSFLLLTKVTPGIGLIWFAARREWRPLAIALGFTGALVTISLVFDAPLWVDWLHDSVLQTAGGAPLNQFSVAIPLLIRLPLAALLVAWGGRTGRPWTVPVGATLALPILWPSGFAVLAALWPIAQRRPELEPKTGRPLRSVPTREETVA
jgi:hypothetical protein